MYLMRRAYGHFRDWLSSTPDKETVKNLADKYNLIIVTSEDETFSFYIDSPVNKDSVFETYITQEVIGKNRQKIPDNSNQKRTRNQWAFNGRTWRLYLSAKHPELFCAVK